MGGPCPFGFVYWTLGVSGHSPFGQKIFRTDLGVTILVQIDLDMGRPWTMCPIDIPNRESLEPQIKKINNRCRLRLLEFLKQTMKPEFEEVMKDPLLSHIMVIKKNNLKFSVRLIQSFLCK